MRVFQLMIGIPTLVYHVLKLLIRPSANINSLIFLGNKLSKTQASLMAADALMKNEAYRNFLMLHEDFPSFDLAKWSTFSEESLGGQLCKFFQSDGLSVYPMPDFRSLSANEKLRELRRRNHDILHVVLNYSTDDFGEAEVNAFSACQTRMPVCFLIIAGLTLKTLIKQPSRFLELIHRIEKAWNRAYDYRPFLIFNWEDVLETPLIKVQSSFRISNMKVVSSILDSDRIQEGLCL